MSTNDLRAAIARERELEIKRVAERRAPLLKAVEDAQRRSTAKAVDEDKRRRRAVSVSRARS